MPIYAFQWEEGWVKLGWANDAMQRASDGWWENSHPTDLCGKLCPPHCELTGLWEGTKEEEKALQEQFNEGMLKKGDVHNEFYPIEEWPKIYRDLMTHHKEMPLQINYPPASGHEKARKKCCGGREYFCQFCPKTFDKASNWTRHVKKVHFKK